jgi:hypothetical protein
MPIAEWINQFGNRHSGIGVSPIFCGEISTTASCGPAPIVCARHPVFNAPKVTLIERANGAGGSEGMSHGGSAFGGEVGHHGNVPGGQDGQTGDAQAAAVHRG